MDDDIEFDTPLERWITKQNVMQRKLVRSHMHRSSQRVAFRSVSRFHAILEDEFLPVHRDIAFVLLQDLWVRYGIEKLPWQLVGEVCAIALYEAIATAWVLNKCEAFFRNSKQ